MFNPDLLCHILIPYLTVRDYCNLLFASGNNRDLTYLDESEMPWKVLYANYHGVHVSKLKRKRKGYKMALIQDFAKEQRDIYKKSIQLLGWEIRDKILTAHGRLNYSIKELDLFQINEELRGADVPHYWNIPKKEEVQAKVKKHQKVRDRFRKILKAQKNNGVDFVSEFIEKFGVHGINLIEEPKRKKARIEERL